MLRSERSLPFGAFTRQAVLPLLAGLMSFTAMQPLYAANSSKNAAPTQASAEDARAQANIDTVMAFYKAAMNADFEQARQYVGYYYIEHDPASEDGIAGLQKALNPSRMGARKTFEIERLVGDGEYVILHARLSPLRGGPPPAGAPAAGGPPGGGAGPPRGAGPPNAQGNAGGNAGPPEFRPAEVAEIFRVFDGKIVEHWKVVQQ